MDHVNTLRGIRGDLRRFETDTRDETHLRIYSKLANITPEQVKIVLDAVFESHVFDGSRVWPTGPGELLSPIQLIDKLQEENRVLKDKLNTLHP